MIFIKAEKAHGEYDPGTSKFLGSPTMPEEWLSDGTVGDNDFFFCQLKLSEFKPFNKTQYLNDKGFLYFFLTENDGKFIPNVQYCEKEPDTLIDDFNAGFDNLGDLETEYSIDYFETDESIDGTGILVEDNSSDIILLQYDPLDDNMPEFLAETEKIGCFIISKADLKKFDFSNVKFELR